MKVNKKRPKLKLGYVRHKQYTGRRIAEKEAIELKNYGYRPYLRKIGKIGAFRSYEVWIINRRY